jgi:hypothetical protein
MTALKALGLTLTTESVSFVIQGTPVRCVHNLEPPPQMGIAPHIGKAAAFVDRMQIVEWSIPDKSQATDRYTVPFSVSYRALDGRHFNQQFLLILDGSVFKSWTEEVGSLVQTPSAEPVMNTKITPFAPPRGLAVIAAHRGG